ncbi:ras guanine nucleotide exchange factor i-related [Anaeramoeba flamelloides]|uniref:Ras guanine nucleotide exchange factor i-related n=1 Tax=Anaeramoeba flamelloides TaxID=1746091 RepID=A0AAV7ZTR1_9EUKA|nr:ras guanine nucleotide exchange factor i-related [Anaeramoeba flamelloides]
MNEDLKKRLKSIRESKNRIKREFGSNNTTNTTTPTRTRNTIQRSTNTNTNTTKKTNGWGKNYPKQTQKSTTTRTYPSSQNKSTTTNTNNRNTNKTTNTNTTTTTTTNTNRNSKKSTTTNPNTRNTNTNINTNNKTNTNTDNNQSKIPRKNWGQKSSYNNLKPKTTTTTKNKTPTITRNTYQRSTNTNTNTAKTTNGWGKNYPKQTQKSTTTRTYSSSQNKSTTTNTKNTSKFPNRTTKTNRNTNTYSNRNQNNYTSTTTNTKNTSKFPNRTTAPNRNTNTSTNKSTTTNIRNTNKNINTNTNNYKNTNNRTNKNTNKHQPKTSLNNKTSQTNEKNTIKTDNVDRREWLLLAMKRNPEIKNLRERVIPIARTESFGRLYCSEREEVKDQLTIELILQLIMQHLVTIGFKHTKKVIEEETKVKYKPRYLRDSRLQSLIRVALKNSDYIWDQTMNEEARKQSEETDSEIGLINYLSSLGYKEKEEDGEDLPSIWEEDSSENIIYVDNKLEEEGEEGSKEIRAASINKLVQLLTHETDPNVLYLKTFLMTYQSFTTPKILFYKLTERYNIPTEKEEQYAKTKQMIKLRVCNFVRFWINDYFSDFNNKLLMELEDFIDNSLMKDGFKSMANNLKKIIKRNINKSNEEIKESTSTEIAPDPKLPKNIFSPKLSLLDVDPEEIARQMTLIEFSIFKKIRPPELLNLAWSESKLKHRALNLIALNKRFNQIPLWVATLILKASRLKLRQNIIGKCIGIAQHLWMLDNFNGSIAVVNGLKTPSVARLHYTFEAVPRRKIEIFEFLSKEKAKLITLNDFQLLLQKISPPCIPYFSVFLNRLKEIEDNNPDSIDGLINFEKRRLIYDVINKIQINQRKGYNFQSVYQIAQLIEKLPYLEESELISKSLKLEPLHIKRDNFN